jgi:5-methylcytosine-specific restriction endonuclease McrA
MQTLVLDVSWAPVSRVPWEEAINWILEGLVEVVEEYEDQFVRSVNLSFKMPSVVRFVAAVGGRRRKVKFNRSNVYQRDNGKCQYCGQKVKMKDFTYDHVTPRAQGGITSWENIVVACVPCNQKKGGRTPTQAKMSLLSQPRKPNKAFSNFVVNMTYEKGMPVTWRRFLGDMAYWNTELEE